MKEISLPPICLRLGPGGDDSHRKTNLTKAHAPSLFHSLVRCAACHCASLSRQGVCVSVCVCVCVCVCVSEFWPRREGPSIECMFLRPPLLFSSLFSSLLSSFR